MHGEPAAPWHLAGLGFCGSPLATTLTRLLQLSALLIALPLCRLRQPRLADCSELMRPNRLHSFAAQMLPRTMSAALEELALQAVGALAGHLGAVPTATHNAMLMSFFWLTSPMCAHADAHACAQTPRPAPAPTSASTARGNVARSSLRYCACRYGVGTATQQRMGFYLGAGNPTAATSVAQLCFMMQLLISWTVAGTLMLARHVIGKLFSSSAAVVHMVADITPLVAGSYCLVGVFYSSMAVLGGQVRMRGGGTSCATLTLVKPYRLVSTLYHALATPPTDPPCLEGGPALPGVRQGVL